jgi:hypothetical protein
MDGIYQSTCAALLTTEPGSRTSPVRHYHRGCCSCSAAPVPRYTAVLQYLGIDAPFCASCLPQIREGRDWPILDHLHHACSVQSSTSSTAPSPIALRCNAHAAPWLSSLDIPPSPLGPTNATIDSHSINLWGRARLRQTLTGVNFCNHSEGLPKLTTAAYRTGLSYKQHHIVLKLAYSPLPGESGPQPEAREYICPCPAKVSKILKHIWNPLDAPYFTLVNRLAALHIHFSGHYPPYTSYITNVSAPSGHGHHVRNFK